MARSDSVGKSQQPQPPQHHFTQTKPTTNLMGLFTRAVKGVRPVTRSLKGRVSPKLPADASKTERKLAALTGRPK
jgi:hypothetical protein